MTFDSCADAYTAGRANIPAGDPAYSRKLDRDGDGVACDQPPPGFRPAPASTGTAEVGTADGGRLPTTGPGEVTAAGGLLLAAGVAVMVVARRRRRRFQA